MSFDFYLPTRILSETNCVLESSSYFKELGSRALIITGKNSARESGALKDVLAALKKEKIEYKIFDGIKQNPLLSDCLKAAKKAREIDADFVVGIGGGSPLDAAKAVAVLAKNKNINKDNILSSNWEERLKIALVGITAGTGSEANPYSILTLEDGKKATFSSKKLYPEISFCDYKYTKTLDKNQTLSTGLDGVAHLTEGYFSKASNDISDMFAILGLKLSLKSFLTIKEKGADNIEISTREDLYQASIYGGIVINKTGTLFCHPLGYFTTEEYDYPHGYACNIFYKELIEWCSINSKKKMESLLFELGLDKKEDLINIFTGYCNFRENISDKKIEEIILEKINTNNFKNTPGNFNKKAAMIIMKNVFKGN